MLLDTSGLLCLHHRDEPQHEDAVRLYHTATRKVTHSYILAEFVALSQARRLPRKPVLGFANDLLDNPDIEVVWVDETLHRHAMTFLLTRLDKGYSLCDAVSFLLMRSRGVLESLTTDAHFEQEGFVRLLKP